MKNMLAGGAAAITLFLAVLGCGDSSSGESGKSNQPSNRPPSNTAVTDVNSNAATAAGATGVRECDELVDSLAPYAENPNDNFAVRASKRVIVEGIKSSVKQAIEDNKNNVSVLTSRCQDIKREFDRSAGGAQQQGQ